MARTTTKKKSATTRKAPSRNGKARGGRAAGPPVNAEGKHLVIVESPTKARTINRYLGSEYVVMASVGHVRDLPSRSPKGVKQEVPGVDIDGNFEPTYDILPDKKKTVQDLRKAAKQAQDVWFATDLDREGEAIAWHLAEALGMDAGIAKRVVFNAITKTEIDRAFLNPRKIDLSKVDAQQARRILDRIVGYKVSPLLWRKVAAGLSAGRVQSVAVRLVVDREREIEAFTPDEYWKITGLFATETDKADALGQAWRKWLADAEDRRILKEQNAWLGERKVLRAELVEYDGKPFKVDNRAAALAAAQQLGFQIDETIETEDEDAKGPAQHICAYRGHVGEARPSYRIQSIQTKRTSSRPTAPFITSTLQQSAGNQLGFAAQRAMRVAQQLYEGIDLGGARGQTGLITYMRTDSTHLSPEALGMARGFISEQFGDKYLPDKPNFYSSSNKDAQEAHEAIRPTDVRLTPQSIRKALGDEQFKLYDLIWKRFVASQMTSAQWDSTTVSIETHGSDAPKAVFRATGRTLVFDGFYKVTGIPGSDELILPPLTEQQSLAPITLDPTQHFTSPPARYTEASLIKRLEAEGIGRPSTYASIIQTVQDRGYVEPLMPRDRRLMATDLGKVVTDMLVKAFPRIMDLPYTREMESELDKIEDERHDWRQMLREFYDPFEKNLVEAHEHLQHAKAVTEPAPYKCAKCEAPTEYRFGKRGRFLSCTRYPDCDYAAPIDKKGKPLLPQLSDIACPDCGGEMTKRVGRFGPFLGCTNYPQCKGIVKLDPKKGTVVLPKAAPLTTDLPCPKCDSPLYMRDSKRGFWLSCSKFPKCRGRLGWTAVDEAKQQELEKQWTAHVKENPVPIIRTRDGKVIGDDYLPQIEGQESSPAEADDSTPSSDAA